MKVQGTTSDGFEAPGRSFESDIKRMITKELLQDHSDILWLASNTEERDNQSEYYKTQLGSCYRLKNEVNGNLGTILTKSYAGNCSDNDGDDTFKISLLMDATGRQIGVGLKSNSEIRPTLRYGYSLFLTLIDSKALRETVKPNT